MTLRMQRARLSYASWPLIYSALRTLLRLVLWSLFVGVTLAAFVFMSRIPDEYGRLMTDNLRLADRKRSVWFRAHYGTKANAQHGLADLYATNNIENERLFETDFGQVHNATIHDTVDALLGESSLVNCDAWSHSILVALVRVWFEWHGFIQCLFSVVWCWCAFLWPMFPLMRDITDLRAEYDAAVCLCELEATRTTVDAIYDLMRPDDSISFGANPTRVAPGPVHVDSSSLRQRHRQQLGLASQ